MLPGNDTIIHGVWLSWGDGAPIRLTFTGSNGVTIANGAHGAWTDPLPPPHSIPADSVPIVWTLWSVVAGGNQIPVYPIAIARGERLWRGADLAAVETFLGSSAASITNGSIVAYGPDFMVAKGWNGKPVPLVVGDSIADRQSDIFGTRREHGWVRRWLDIDDGAQGRIAHMNMGVSGAASHRELVTGSSDKRWDVVDQIIAFNGGKRPFTCILDQMGVNDYHTTYATMRDRYAGLLDRLAGRYPGVAIIGLGNTPRTSSTNNFRTVEGQADQAGAAYPSGTRWNLQIDAASTLIDGRLAAYIPTAQLWTTTNYKWPAAQWVTSLTAQAGTDGTSGYAGIQIADEPIVGDFLRWGANGAQAGAVLSYSGGPGAWVVTLDRSTNVAVVAAGGEVYSAATQDGIHPRIHEVARMAAEVPQSEKAKLR